MRSNVELTYMKLIVSHNSQSEQATLKIFSNFSSVGRNLFSGLTCLSLPFLNRNKAKRLQRNGGNQSCILSITAAAPTHQKYEQLR